MARVLIKTISAISLDPKKDALLYKRGDVVKIAPDGYYFGNKIEKNNPKFSIIELPGVAVSKLNSLIETETTGEGDTLQIIKRRKQKINLEAMTIAEQNGLESKTRSHELTEARLIALTEVKA